jgi:hypothetical protein
MVGKKLTTSLKIEKIVCDGVEIDYTGQYKNNARMSTHLAELIFPSTSVIVPTPSLQIHPKTLKTRAPPLRLSYSPKHMMSIVLFGHPNHQTLI